MSEWVLDDEAPKTREALAADKLREAILVGHFEPGERLDQLAISKRLDVSLSPIREAIRTLAAEGLVTMYPHRGAHVAKLTAPQIEELHFVRQLLEGAAARKATPHLSAEHLERLNQIIARAEASPDFDELQALNHEFHNTLYGATPQVETMKLINHLRNKIAPYMRLYLAAGLRHEEWTDHRRITDACQTGDPKRVEREVRRHLSRVCASIMQTFAVH